MTDLRRLAEAAQVGPWSRRYIETRALAYIAAASPAAILALLNERDRLRAERNAMRAALEQIKDMHIGDCPMALAHMSDLEWAQRWVRNIRLVARDALAALDAEQEGGS